MEKLIKIKLLVLILVIMLIKIEIISHNNQIIRQYNSNSKQVCLSGISAVSV